MTQGFGVVAARGGFDPPKSSHNRWIREPSDRRTGALHSLLGRASAVGHRCACTRGLLQGCWPWAGSQVGLRTKQAMGRITLLGRPTSWTVAELKKGKKRVVMGHRARSALLGL